MRERVIPGSVLALDQFLWQIWSSGSSSLGFGFGSQRPTGCKGEKAPEGAPSLRRSAMLDSGSSDSASSWYSRSSRKG